MSNTSELNFTGILFLIIGLIERIPPIIQLILMILGIIFAGISATINVLNYLDRKKKERQEKS